MARYSIDSEEVERWERTNAAWRARFHRKHRDRNTATRGSKLTWEQVGEIRQRRAAGETLEQIGRSYGVTRENIRLITSGMTWRGEKPA
jgi:DNA-directed RNA polymerase sigma subunit (sigma70/sigma32)